MSVQEKVRHGLQDTAGREARLPAITAIRDRVPVTVKEYPTLQKDVRHLKERAMADLPQLVQQAATALSERGFQVYLAKDAETARGYVLDHMEPNSRVIKSKSNQAKEIHLPEALAAAGHSLVETDLGDRINQLLGRRSGHVLAPAISVPAEEIRDAFRTTFNQPDLSTDENELVAAARAHMRPILLDADVGISGANAVTATGEVVLMENEGNIRAVTGLPRLHFVMAAITKIVETLEDALSVVQAASIFGVGQDFGNYCTVLSGPATKAGPEIHVVLIDDGRSEARTKEPEPLMCINCGSCLNVCPVFSELGEDYGGERIGGIGVIQTYLLNGSQQALDDGLDLCLGCQRCIPACPVEIDTPGVTSRFRAEISANRRMPAVRRRVLRAVLSRSQLKFGRWLLGLGENLGVNAKLRRRGQKSVDFIPAPDPGPSVTPGRLYPAPASVRKGQVLLFTGCVMDALYGKIHHDTITVLNYNGWDVLVPDGQACCGALHYHAGHVTPVDGLISQNLESLAGTDPIILNSAGCGAFLKEYPHLPSSRHEECDALAQRVYDLTEFLTTFGFTQPTESVARRVAYHNPCHMAYAQRIEEPPLTLLRSVPAMELVPFPEREACCGSAGTFNLEMPELSWRLARDKAQDAVKTEAEWIITANPGCLMQIRAGFEAEGSAMKVLHIAEILAEAYRGSKKARGDRHV